MIIIRTRKAMTVKTTKIITMAIIVTIAIKVMIITLMTKIVIIIIMEK